MTESSRAERATPRLVLITILRWGFGFALSLLVIWAVTAIGTESLYSRAWSESLGRNAPLPGTTFNNRYEAWGTTHFGAMGMPGIDEIENASVGKILIWGDSFVAAMEVGDEHKMHSQLQRLIDESKSEDYQILPVGYRFQSFADYYFQAPRMEKAVGPIALHVVHLYGLEDMYPDRSGRISDFLSEPKLHFVEYHNEFKELEEPVVYSNLKDRIYRMRLHFFLRMKKRALQIAKLEGLRFSLGHQSLRPSLAAGAQAHCSDGQFDAPWLKEEMPMDAWEFAIRSFKQRVDAPILFVYAPTTPHLKEGEIFTANPEAEVANAFEEICQEQGVGFLSMEKAFLEFHRDTGRFFKGFAHQRPWTGHYNRDGHRLVAEAIHQWIKEHPNAIHPD